MYTTVLPYHEELKVNIYIYIYLYIEEYCSEIKILLIINNLNRWMKIKTNMSTHYQNWRRILNTLIKKTSRSQWPRDLKCGSAAVRLLGLWFWIQLETWMSVSCECCVLSGRGFCVGLVIHSEESYRAWCVWEWS
jgi:hypothetical protein